MRKIIISILLLIILLVNGNASFVRSEFKCNSSPNSVMMHYSYLKEPKLIESGFTLGYKSGSLNYLNGEITNFEDELKYDDGNETHGNSSVYHKQIVDFEGEGISEFYAMGFYPSNRVLSAWKKVRYDNLTYGIITNPPYSRGDTIYLNRSKRGTELVSNYSPIIETRKYQLGNSYEKSKLNVVASVSMGPTGESGLDYDFRYKLSASNSVFDMSESSGWSNRTGSRRTDWEQTALIKGNINVTNNLEASGLFIPAGEGELDWLPCCFVGTLPEVNQVKQYYGYAMLQPDKKLPQLNTTCMKDCKSNCSPKCYNQCNNSCTSECEEECDNLSGVTYKETCKEDCMRNNKDAANITKCLDGCSKALDLKIKCLKCLDQCTDVCLNNCTNDCTSKCEDNCPLTCNMASCPGYECINTYEGGEVPGGGRGPGTRDILRVPEKTDLITIKKVTYELNGADTDENVRDGLDIQEARKGNTIKFKMTVSHTNTKSPLSAITVNDTLPSALMYTHEVIVKKGDTVLDDQRYRSDTNPTLRTVNWTIYEPIESGQEIIIEAKFMVKEGFEGSTVENRAYATGIFGDVGLRTRSRDDGIAKIKLI